MRSLKMRERGLSFAASAELVGSEESHGCSSAAPNPDLSVLRSLPSRPAPPAENKGEELICSPKSCLKLCGETREAPVWSWHFSTVLLK